MKGIQCNIRYQNYRCRNDVTQYVRNEEKVISSGVNYIILTLRKVTLQLFHRDVLLHTLNFRYKGKFLPVHTMKAYMKGSTVLLILNLVNEWK